MTITLFIIVATVIVSVSAFNRQDLFYRLDFQPFSVTRDNEFHRFITHAFLHADYGHLAVNMYVLYAFGGMVETAFESLFEQKWILYFLMLYLGGILFSALPGFGRHKDNAAYHAVGASGAVSAVVYSFILIDPMRELSFLVFPFFKFPAVVFGVIYLALEIYLDRRGGSRIAHSAHYVGGIFGAVFTVILYPELILQYF